MANEREVSWDEVRQGAEWWGRQAKHADKLLAGVAKCQQAEGKMQEQEAQSRALAAEIVQQQTELKTIAQRRADEEGLWKVLEPRNRAAEKNIREAAELESLLPELRAQRIAEEKTIAALREERAKFQKMAEGLK